MTRVVCPICKSGFEARITREDYAINCVSCGVAFNAAAFLPEAEFRALAQRRPAAGSRSRYDRGTQALGGVIRPAPAKPTAYSGPVSPSTRTGGLAFMYEDPEPAPLAPPAHVAQPPSAVHGRGSAAEGGCATSPQPQARPTPTSDAAARPAQKSFFEASVTTSRFRPPAAGADASAAPAAADSRRLPDLGAVHSPYRPTAEEPRRSARTTRSAPLPPGAASNVLLRSWLAPEAPAPNSQASDVAQPPSAVLRGRCAAESDCATSPPSQVQKTVPGSLLPAREKPEAGDLKPETRNGLCPQARAAPARLGRPPPAAPGRQLRPVRNRRRDRARRRRRGVPRAGDRHGPAGGAESPARQ